MPILRVLGALVLFAIFGQGLAQLRNGTYEVRFYDPRTKRIEAQPKGLPPGQVRRGFVSGLRFAVLDMMNGFQGPIRKAGKDYEFVFAEGPAGKVKGKPEVARVRLSADGKTLTFIMKGIARMTWHWKRQEVPIRLPY